MTATAATDRERMRGCDRCGAPPMAIILVANGELRMCGHHSRIHGKAIIAVGGVIIPIGKSALVPA